MAVPKTLVVAEDVDQGKPDPACYLLGRSRLSLDKKAKMLVLEDSPAGVKAGKAAGFVSLPKFEAFHPAIFEACLEKVLLVDRANWLMARYQTVVGLATTHPVERLQQNGADYIVQDLRSVTLKSWSSASRQVDIEIANALVV